MSIFHSFSFARAISFQKHKEWLKRRTADKISAGFVESDDPYQKIKYFKKLIKFKNQNDASAVNEISFVPHLSETKDAIYRTRNNDDELTTVIIDTGNKFAYDTVNNNEDSDFASNKAAISGGEKSHPRRTKMRNEVEPSSAESSTNIINENNEPQESAFDVSSSTVKNQMEVSSNEQHIGNTTIDVDTKSNRNVVAASDSAMNSKNEISAVANSTSTEKNSNDFEIRKFISEHIKYKSNNITIKKSWSKWSPWSGCSRSCGEGVMSQSRECTEKM